MNSVDQLNCDCRDLLEEHERQARSTLWFFVAVVGGTAGIALIDPSFLSVVVTALGVIGGGEWVYDRSKRLIEEQGYLRLYWEVEARKDRLRAEFARRGLL